MSTIAIKIDGQELEIDEKTNVAITLNIADIEEPDKSSTGYCKTFDVPITPRNRRIFGFTEQIYSRDQYNNAVHTAKIFSGGITIMSGAAQMDKYKDDNRGGGYYSVKIMGAAFEWVQNAQKMVKELVSDDRVVYQMDDVYRNSVDPTHDRLIRFVPIDRGGYWTKIGDGSFAARDRLDIRDYHPFINAWQLLRLIMKGFTIKSSLEYEFAQLYLSGYLSKNEQEEGVKLNNDFYAGTDPKSLIIVKDSWMPVLVGLFDILSGGDFFAENGVLSQKLIYLTQTTFFTPTEALKASFEINLQFECALKYNRDNGRELIFVDKFYFGCSLDGSNFKYLEEIDIDIRKSETLNKAANGDRYIPYQDFNPEDRNREFVLRIKFNNPSAFRRVYTKLGAKHEVYYPIDNATWGSFTENKDVITDLLLNIKPGDNWIYFRTPDHPPTEVTTGNILGHPEQDFITYTFFRVMVEASDGESSELQDLNSLFVDYDFYAAGDAGVDGLLKFNISLKTNAFSIAQGQPFPLNFGVDCSQKVHLMKPGALGSGMVTDPMKVTFSDVCTIKPNFGGTVGLGDDVGISTIGGDIKQIDVIAALRHMYNLMFYTNPITREVIIEPRPYFYELGDEEMRAGDELELVLSGVLEGQSYDLSDYDIIVRLGDKNGGFALVGYSDKKGDFEMERRGSDIIVRLSADQTRRFTPFQSPEISIALRHKYTGAVEIDEQVLPRMIGVVVDWSDRIDLSKQIEIEELGSDMGSTLKLAYASGGDVLERYNLKNNIEFGTHVEPLLKKTAKEPTELVNPIYAPAVTRDVPSMGFDDCEIIQDALEGDQKEISDVEMDITPVVACFLDVRGRTRGSDVGKYPQFPLMLFGSQWASVNLSFENMPDTISSDYGEEDVEYGAISYGPSGLYEQYYKGNVQAYNYGRRITAYIHINPVDIESILYPNNRKRDFRARFKLKVNGESVYCRLEQIIDYNPASGEATKCVFVKLD